MWNRRVGRQSKHPLVIAFVLAGFGLLASPSTAGTITVGWDLMSETNVTGYRVYVGTSSQTYTQTFDVPADKDFFIFRNAYMGVRYFFAVAAQFDNTTYGPRSGEVSAVGTRTVAGPLPDGARVPDPVRAAECGADCFVVTDVARGLHEISSLAVTSDGLVFAIERGRRVVVFRAGTAVTAFEAAPGTTLRDLAIDPRFETTGRVFVSLLRSHDGRSGDLEVLRMRHLAGTLGEPSTIVAGPTVPLAASVPLAIGDDGMLYVALPVLTARHPYSAAILAFDQEGRAPAGQSSPVVARGLDEPVDMAWDAQSRAFWLVGRTADSAEVHVVSLSRTADGAAVSALADAGENAAAVTVASGAARRLVVAAGVDLIEAAPGSTDTLRISLEAYGVPVAVATHAGARYVATRNEGGSAAYRVVKVEDGSTAAAR